MTAAPAPQLTNEQLAASKFQGARLLWKNGNSDAARRWLEVVVRDYGNTAMADRARVALARL
jgi:TolA-binding protein